MKNIFKNSNKNLNHKKIFAVPSWFSKIFLSSKKFEKRYDLYCPNCKKLYQSYKYKFQVPDNILHDCSNTLISTDKAKLLTVYKKKKKEEKKI